MDAGNQQNIRPVISLEALLRESMRFQAISEQLIRESRELRTICMLIHHTYNYQHEHLKKHEPVSMIIVEQE